MKKKRLSSCVRIALVTASAGIVGGCAAPTVVQLGTNFDASAAQRMLAPGPYQVSGSAFLRQRGGGVVTCAGSTVHLVPATLYAERVYSAMYGTTQGPAMRTTGALDLQPKSDEFGRLMRRTECDAQGNFRFTGVADGDYYVESTVTWMAGDARQGGPVMRRVRVASGDVSIVVAP